MRPTLLSLLSILLLATCGSTDRATQSEGPIAYDSQPELYARGQAEAAQSPALLNLQGSWVSAFDDREVVTFTPNSYTSYYDGEMIIEEQLDFFLRCPEACGVGPMTSDRPCFVVSGDYDATCYIILSVDADRLELRLASGEGGTITYFRR